VRRPDDYSVLPVASFSLPQYRRRKGRVPGSWERRGSRREKLLNVGLPSDTEWLLVLGRAVRRHGLSGLTGIVLLGLAAALLLVAPASKHHFAVERQALDGRGMELLARAVVPGSPLACLDGSAGETVESSCERLLFASPQQTAAAVAYVSAQLALFADYASLRRRMGGPEPAGLVDLRQAIEADRFGLVAQVLASRDGCTPDRCETLALLKHASRVRAALFERPFDSHVARYAVDWPTGVPPALASMRNGDIAPRPLPWPAGISSLADAPGATANSLGSSATAASTPMTMAGSRGGLLRKDIFLPSASSIPPVNIMTTEPAKAGPAEPAGPKKGAAAAAKSKEKTAVSAGAAAKETTAPARKPIRSADRPRPPVEPSRSRVPMTAASSQ
jgi:hypothetical protein